MFVGVCVGVGVGMGGGVSERKLNDVCMVSDCLFEIRRRRRANSSVEGCTCVVMSDVKNERTVLEMERFRIHCC